LSPVFNRDVGFTKMVPRWRMRHRDLFSLTRNRVRRTGSRVSFFRAADISDLWASGSTSPTKMGQKGSPGKKISRALPIRISSVRATHNGDIPAVSAAQHVMNVPVVLRDGFRREPSYIIEKLWDRQVHNESKQPVLLTQV